MRAKNAREILIVLVLLLQDCAGIKSTSKIKIKNGPLTAFTRLPDAFNRFQATQIR
ncbi:MAG: hypothetical protein AB9869_13480 [Verrucomicrobiia bacterium]